MYLGSAGYFLPYSFFPHTISTMCLRKSILSGTQFEKRVNFRHTNDLTNLKAHFSTHYKSIPGNHIWSQQYVDYLLLLLLSDLHLDGNVNYKKCVWPKC
jgi:hypothetical protein